MSPELGDYSIRGFVSSLLRFRSEKVVRVWTIYGYRRVEDDKGRLDVALNVAERRRCVFKVQSSSSTF